MVVFRKPDSETAVVFRALAISCVSFTVLAIPAIAQCPDGTPPPCARPSPPPAPPGPRLGVASLRVLASTPIAGTTLKWQDLEKGVPLHVVVEHAVQRVPRGQTPVLAAFVNLTPAGQQAGQRRVLGARVITTRPTQRALDWVLTTEHVQQQRITVEIHVAFSLDTNLTSPRGLRLSFDWAASTTLEFPVADSSGAAFAPPLAQLATGPGQDRANPSALAIPKLARTPEARARYLQRQECMSTFRAWLQSLLARRIPPREALRGLIEFATADFEADPAFVRYRESCPDQIALTPTAVRRAEGVVSGRVIRA